MDHIYCKELKSQDAECQTTASAKDIQTILDENKELRSKTLLLRKNLNDLTLDYDSFRNNDAKSAVYTPFKSWKTFDDIYAKIKPKILIGTSINKFQMVLLFLMRLKLNFTSTHLSNIFHISEATVNRIFPAIFDILYLEVSENGPKDPTIETLDPGEINVSKVLYVDFLCLNIDKVYAPSTISEMSGYSGCYMILSTCDKYVLKVSKWHAVTTSYCENLQQSGLLTDLEDGVVLASKFAITDCDRPQVKFGIVKTNNGVKYVERLEVPDEVQNSSKLHVRNTTGYLRRSYKMLNSYMPFTFLTNQGDTTIIIDKIVFLCASLLNLSIKS